MLRKQYKKILALLLAICFAAACVGCGSVSEVGSKNYRITLITMDQSDVHWANVNAGVEDAIEELEADGYAITYNWYAPDTKDNAKQIEEIDMAASNRSDLIMIAVNDPTACNQALAEAAEDGAKIIYIDSPATYEAEASFATDNYEAGRQAGEELISILEGAGVTGGMVGLVSAQAGVQSCIDRIDGFCDALEGTAYITSEVQYSESDTAKAQEMATNLINNGAIALFGANEAATVGCGNAAKDAVNDIYCIGFDNSSANRTLVRNGMVQAFMAQNPWDMGYMAMKAAAQILDGETLTETDVDTGVTVVTAENVEDFED